MHKVDVASLPRTQTPSLLLHEPYRDETALPVSLPLGYLLFPLYTSYSRPCLTLVLPPQVSRTAPSGSTGYNTSVLPSMYMVSQLEAVCCDDAWPRGGVSGCVGGVEVKAEGSNQVPLR